MKKAVALGFIFLIIAGLCGCGALEEELVASVLTSITVSPSSVTLARSSDFYKFTATGYDQLGRSMFIVPTWIASIEAGTITQGGILTVSSEAGTGKIRAYVGTIEGTATVTVTGGILETITVSPPTPSDPFIAYTGNEYQFSAAGKDSLGNTVSLYPNWSLDPADIGIIGQNGVFFPLVTGEGYYVVASQTSVSGSAEVDVLAPGSP